MVLNKYHIDTRMSDTSCQMILKELRFLTSLTDIKFNSILKLLLDNNITDSSLDEIRTCSRHLELLTCFWLHGKFIRIIEQEIEFQKKNCLKCKILYKIYVFKLNRSHLPYIFNKNKFDGLINNGKETKSTNFYSIDS